MKSIYELSEIMKKIIVKKKKCKLTVVNTINRHRPYQFESIRLLTCITFVRNYRLLLLSLSVVARKLYTQFIKKETNSLLVNFFDVLPYNLPTFDLFFA